MQSVLLATLLSSGLALLAEPTFAAPTNKPDEPNAKELRTWYREQNHLVNARFAKSKNRKAVEKWLHQIYDETKVARSFDLRGGEKLKLVRQGYAGATRLILEKEGKSRVLFSNLDVKKNHTIGIKDISLSEDQKSVAIVMYEKGSLDLFRIAIYDLANRRMRHDKIASASDRVAWEANDSLVLMSPSKDGRKVQHFDINTGRTTVEGNSLSKTGANWSAYNIGDKTTRFFDFSGVSVKTGAQSVSEIGGKLGEWLFFVSSEGNGSVRKLSLTGNDKDAETIFENDNRVIDGIERTKDGGAMVATSHWGAEQFIVLIRDDGSRIEEIGLPDCCSYGGARLSDDGRKLIVSLKSHFEKGHEFTYDLSAKSWEEHDLQEKMLNYKGVPMVSEIVEISSKDGTKIPMRITRRKNLKTNGANPVLIRAYGGFNLPGSLAPAWDPLHADFVLKGGILASPGIRGGNEFGKKWWEDAKNQHKNRTLDDLIASADSLVKLHWTKPEFIITRGASNGGFVVAAAALRSPGSFGLVFPAVGVYDTEDIKTLDTPFAAYWQREYGDPSDSRAKELMRELSPVVQGEKVDAIPRMVVIAAVNDSRVNYLHSMRFGQALKQNDSVDVKNKFEVVTLKNAGHFVYSMPYQDLIAFRTNSIIWSTIFDHVGWKFSP